MTLIVKSIPTHVSSNTAEQSPSGAKPKPKRRYTRHPKVLPPGVAHDKVPHA